jgi:hypothetical protein
MAFKEYTAEEAFALMRKDLSKREKRFAMSCIRNAARGGHSHVDFDVNWFKVAPKTLRNYFENLGYKCVFFCNKVQINWGFAAAD